MNAHFIESAVCLAICLGCLAVFLADALRRVKRDADEPIPYTLASFGDEPTSDWEREAMAQRIRRAIGDSDREVAEAIWSLPTRVKR